MEGKSQTNWSILTLLTVAAWVWIWLSSPGVAWTLLIIGIVGFVAYWWFVPNKEEVFDIEIVGEYYDNDDGTSRQEIITRAKVGDPVTLSFYTYHGEPACAVKTADGQIGHLPRDIADEMLQEVASADDVTATITDIYRNDLGTLNVAIRITTK